jgi:hypothetical protein
MSTELPFFEGQADALINTIWWGLDHRFGGQARKRASEDPNSLNAIILRKFDSVAFRVCVVGSIPYLLRPLFPTETPFRWAIILIALYILGPWLYSIFIYTPFLDPLRHLPHLKVSFSVEN